MKKIKNFLFKVYMDLKTFFMNSRFGLNYAFYFFMSDKIKKNTNRKKKYNQKVFNFIRKYFSSIFGNIFLSHQDKSLCNGEIEKAPIWVCWLDGIEKAPKLVKKCLVSVLKNSNGHPVILITENNFTKFVNIDTTIYDKYKKGYMQTAHFCDYLRVCLIAQNGGLWLDSTILLTGKICEDFFSKPFFTIKSRPNAEMVADGRWSSFCLSGCKGNKIFVLAKECFEKYWQRSKSPIHYFMLDHIFDSIYDNDSECKRMFDCVRETNPDVDYLREKMIEGLVGNNIEDFIRKGTTIYKLSWRIAFPMLTNGRETLFAHFLNDEDSFIGDNFYENCYIN